MDALPDGPSGFEWLKPTVELVLSHAHGVAAGDDLPWRTLGELVLAVRAFLDPVLAGTTGRWDPQAWQCQNEQDGLEPEDAGNGAIMPPVEDR